MPPRLLIAALAIAVSACSLFPNWHWERPGASAADYEADLKHCKLLVYPGVDGMVTKQSVRAMHACMEGRGWRKVTD